MSEEALKDFATEVLNLRILQKTYRQTGFSNLLEAVKRHEEIVDRQIVKILNLPQINALNIMDNGIRHEEPHN